MLQARSWLPRTEGSVRLDFARRARRNALGSCTRPALRARVSQALPRGSARGRAAQHGRRPDRRRPHRYRRDAGGRRRGDRHHRGGREDLSRPRWRGRDRRRACASALARPWPGCRNPPSCSTSPGSIGRTEVVLAGDASPLAIETLIFGRTAMGEDVLHGACRDVWQVRRDGALVFADAFRVEGAVADSLNRPATLDGARAVAMLLYVAPDAADRSTGPARCWRVPGRRRGRAMERPVAGARHGAPTGAPAAGVSRRSPNG